MAVPILGTPGSDELFGDQPVGGDPTDDPRVPAPSQADPANDTISGGGGNDILHGLDSDDILNGEDGADLLNGDAGNDSLFGGAGNDVLDGGAGDDAMAGGDDDDTYLVDSVGDVVTEDNTDTGIDNVESSVTYTLGANLENLFLAGAGAINGTGNDVDNLIFGNNAANTLDGAGGNDLLQGGGGDDTIFGGAGDDELIGEDGVDTLVGGTGDDIYSISDNDDGSIDTITEAAGAAGGVDVVDSFAFSYTLAANVENLVLNFNGFAFEGIGNELDNVIEGNNSNNSLSGADGSDELFGEGGNDTLLGGAGDDFLDGGRGTNRLEGGLGDDSYFITRTGNTIIENSGAGTGIDTVTSSITLTLATNVENLNLIGNRAINGTGNGSANDLVGNTGSNILSGLGGTDTLAGGSGNDTLLGGDGSDQLFGDGGNDLLNGEASNDLLVGGLGDDTYVVDNLFDVVRESFGAGNDIVQSSVTHTLSADVERLTLTGTGAINGTGNNLNNTIIGNSGANTISGAAGNDILTGNGGNDRFLYSTNAAFNVNSIGSDTITDFIRGQDKFILDKTTFTALASNPVGTLSASNFAIVATDAAAATSTARIVYSDTGNLFYNQNGGAAGLGTGGQFATIANNVPLLSNTDFLVQA